MIGTSVMKDAVVTRRLVKFNIKDTKPISLKFSVRTKASAY